MSIEITKQCIAPELKKALAQRVYTKISQHVQFPKGFEISVVVVGDATMKQLNAQYRNVNEVTDVLSFPYNEQNSEQNSEMKGFTEPGGEVVIDYAQAKRQAQSKQTSIAYELSWLLTHGILHVMGYDHEVASDAKVMRPLEKTILHAIWPKE